MKLFRPRAERESEAAHQGGFPGCTGQHGKGSQCQGAPKHLGTAPAEYPSAQAPQPLGFELQPDQEQHRHHAEFGEMKDVLDVGDQAQPERADGDTGGEVADDGPSPSALLSGTAMTAALRYMKLLTNQAGAACSMPLT